MFLRILEVKIYNWLSILKHDFSSRLAHTHLGTAKTVFSFFLERPKP